MVMLVDVLCYFLYSFNELSVCRSFLYVFGEIGEIFFEIASDLIEGDTYLRIVDDVFNLRFVQCSSQFTLRYFRFSQIGQYLF